MSLFFSSLWNKSTYLSSLSHSALLPLSCLLPYYHTPACIWEQLRYNLFLPSIFHSEKKKCKIWFPAYVYIYMYTYIYIDICTRAHRNEHIYSFHISIFVLHIHIAIYCYWSFKNRTKNNVHISTVWTIKSTKLICQRWHFELNFSLFALKTSVDIIPRNWSFTKAGLKPKQI